MLADNFSSGVTALVLIGIIVIGLAIYVYLTTRETDRPKPKIKPVSKDMNFADETFSRPAGAVDSWPERQAVPRGTGERHPFRKTPSPE